MSSGIGSGWDPFIGAVDNISIGFTGGTLQTFNFEVASTEPVPEPATMALMGLGALIALKRRRKS